MASFNSSKIDFTPQHTNNYWRVELVAWLIKRDDPELQGEKLQEIAFASNDVVRTEFTLALTGPQFAEIRQGRSISKMWSRLEDIFEYYGPVSEAPLFRQVAHQFLDGNAETKEMLRVYLDGIVVDEDSNPSCPSPLTVLRNLVQNPPNFRLRRKITAKLDPLGILCGVEKLCGCNPYIPAHEIPESRHSLIDCLYCKYDIPTIRVSQGRLVCERNIIRKTGRACNEPCTNDRGKPYMKTQLLSISKLTTSEHHIIFKRDEATVISKTGDVKFRATRAGPKFYKMELDGVKTQPPDYADFATWHRRLGHIDFRDLHCGHKKFAYRGFKLIKSSKNESPSCRVCQAIKLPGLPLRPVPQVETQILQIIHADFCGPIPGQPKDKSIFFITFTDDASGWMAMYFVRRCSEILKFFREYVTQAESLFKRKIGSIQSNDGLGHNFEDYLKVKGIERLKIPTDTQHIRALLETAKCLLMQSGLDDSFYCEALNTACFIRNRSSSSRLDGLTPYQKWYGRPPSLRHMHEFGAKVTCTTSKDPNKAKAETKEGQYLGFTKKKKAYRIWIPQYQQIVLSDEVDFQDYVNSKDEKKRRVERQTSSAGGTVERPSTSRDSDATKCPAKGASSVITRRSKTRSKYSRYDSNSPDCGFSRAPPKYDKDIHDYIKGKCNHFEDDSSEEDSDSDMDVRDTINEEEELDTLEGGIDSDEDVERRILTAKPVRDVRAKQSKLPGSSVGGGEPGAIWNDQGTPGLEGTRTPSIPIAPTRPRDN